MNQNNIKFIAFLLLLPISTHIKCAEPKDIIRDIVAISVVCAVGYGIKYMHDSYYTLSVTSQSDVLRHTTQKERVNLENWEKLDFLEEEKKLLQEKFLQEEGERLKKLNFELRRMRY